MNESRFLRQIPRELLAGDLWMSQPTTSSPSPAQPERPGEPYVVYDKPPGGGGQPFRSRFSQPRRSHPWQQQRGLPAGAPKLAEEAAGEPEEPRFVPEPEDEVASMLRPGTRVIHPRYGAGEVRAIEGSPASPRARIFFRRSGIKLVYLNNAELEIVSA